MFIGNRYIDTNRAIRGSAAIAALFVAAVGAYSFRSNLATAVGQGGGASCARLLVDTSGGTARDGDLTVRGNYLNEASAAIRNVSSKRGRIYVATFAGTAPAGQVEKLDFSESTGNSYQDKSDRAYKVQTTISGLRARLEDPRNTVAGSAIVGSMNFLAANSPKGCDEMTVLTDGIEFSELADFSNGGKTALLADGAVEALVNKLDDLALLPDLSGQTLRMPALTAMSGSGAQTTVGVERRRTAVADFWAAYADRTGATLVRN